ncbi:hypothetical protein D3C72_1135100 [compost metagenome]
MPEVINAPKATRPSAVEVKRARLAEAHRVIDAIAAVGRRFFYHERDDRTARMEVDDRGRVWWIDEYRGDRIYASEVGAEWRHFSNGGTLKAIAEELVVYVKTGKPVRRGHFGPWPEWLAGPGGDRWGYGAEAMDAVRAAVSELPAVARPAPSAPAEGAA